MWRKVFNGSIQSQKCLLVPKISHLLHFGHNKISILKFKTVNFTFSLILPSATISEKHNTQIHRKVQKYCFGVKNATFIFIMDTVGLSYKNQKKSILPTCYCEFYSAWCHYVFDPPSLPRQPETYPHLGCHPSPQKNVAQFIRHKPRDASS